MLETAGRQRSIDGLRETASSRTSAGHVLEPRHSVYAAVDSSVPIFSTGTSLHQLSASLGAFASLCDCAVTFTLGTGSIGGSSSSSRL